MSFTYPHRNQSWLPDVFHDDLFGLVSLKSSSCWRSWLLFFLFAQSPNNPNNTLLALIWKLWNPFITRDILIQSPDGNLQPKEISRESFGALSLPSKRSWPTAQHWELYYSHEIPLCSSCLSTGSCIWCNSPVYIVVLIDLMLPPSNLLSLPPPIYDKMF